MNQSHLDVTSHNATTALRSARPLTIIKVGGNEIQDEDFLTGLVEWIQKLRTSSRDVLIVHGGGQAIERLQNELAVPIEKVRGIRRTTYLGMKAVRLALLGETGPDLCLSLVRRGLPAIALSAGCGQDRPWLQAKRLMHMDGESIDLGYVGEIDEVDPAPALAILNAGYLPVVAPVATDMDGHWLNVNADDAASALAHFLRAHELFFLTNVPGLMLNGQVIHRVSLSDMTMLRNHPEVQGGMLPKISAAARARINGTPIVGIGNIDSCRSQTMTLMEP